MDSELSDLAEVEAAAWPPRTWQRSDIVIISAVFLVLFLIVNGLQFWVIGAANGGMDVILDEGIDLETMSIPFSATLVTLVGFAIAGLGTVVAVGLWRGYSLESIGFQPTTGRWYLLAVVLAAALIVFRLGLGALLIALLPELAEGGEALSQFLGNNDNPAIILASFFLASFLVPLWEETFFRGFVHNALRNRFGRWPSILLGALIFGLFHLDPLQVITAFLLGVALHWLYEESHSLYPSILLHVINNLFAQGLLYLAIFFGAV